MQVRFASEFDHEEWEWQDVTVPKGWAKHDEDPKKLAKLLVSHYDETVNEVIDPISPKVKQAMGDCNHGFAWIADSGQGGGDSLVEWKK